MTAGDVSRSSNEDNYPPEEGGWRARIRTLYPLILSQVLYR